MDLSPKAIRFLIDALDHYESLLGRRIQDEECLADDELADLANDRRYLMAIRQDLQNYHQNLSKVAEPIA